ncbi:general secretion pathway protein K [Ectopseudomonas oleovorans]|uniref:General secretion pathway protein K n=1 Tax=Ectopseudomonas oleovorans TaxID=301 RepID=A0A379JZJ4_ECTOL|nr:general secretion pathway protein K [Pseudomonas oleovorans]
MKRQKGVALITVLLVVAVVTVVCAGLIARQQLSIRSSANQLHVTQAWHYALGGETLAKAMLERDLRHGDPRQPVDHLLEPWASRGRSRWMKAASSGTHRRPQRPLQPQQPGAPGAAQRAGGAAPAPPAVASGASINPMPSACWTGLDSDSGVAGQQWRRGRPVPAGDTAYRTAIARSLMCPNCACCWRWRRPTTGAYCPSSVRCRARRCSTSTRPARWCSPVCPTA